MNDKVTPGPTAEIDQWLRGITPARVFTGRAGTSLPTGALLGLRADHAAARDAVSARLDVSTLGGDFVEVRTEARDHAQYLRRPDLGRRLDSVGRQALADACELGVDVQVVVGDGLSATAVHSQVPLLLPGLLAGFAARGWSVGSLVAVHGCRVGVMNEVGDVVGPKVVVLLIGERPGLATAESLSAYLAFRPRSGHTDAERNLLSNIHADGIAPVAAVGRILSLAATMMSVERSGVGVSEATVATLGE